MALTVETGAGVAGADSYISLADARIYATSRGIALSVTDATAEVQLRNAFDYLETLTDYKGQRVASDQATQWPRSGVFLFPGADEVAIDEIPLSLKYAQVQLAAAVNSGLDLQPTANGDPFIVRDKVGPIETQYSFTVSTSGVPIVRAASSLLSPLLNGGGSFLLSTERA